MYFVVVTRSFKLQSKDYYQNTSRGAPQQCILGERWKRCLLKLCVPDDDVNGSVSALCTRVGRKVADEVTRVDKQAPPHLLPTVCASR